MSARISRDDLKAELQGPAPPVLIDTLPARAFRERHLPGAINIPSEKIVETAPRVIPDRSTAIVVYCGSGPCRRSRLSAERLTRLGYTEVRDYHEGREDWEAAGLAVERG